MSSMTLYKIVANSSLGFVFFGYTLGYLNPSLKTIDKVFEIDNDVEYYNGLLSAIPSLSAGLGVLFTPTILNAMSRRNSMIFLDLIGILACISQTIGTWNTLILGRFLMGLATGLNSAMVPIYVSEFTPPKYSGTTGGIMTSCGCFGVFLSFLFGLNYELEPQSNNQYWQFVFAFPIIICLLRTWNLYVNFPLDPPPYYANLKQTELCKQSLSLVYQSNEVEMQYQNILGISIMSEGKEESYMDLLKPKYLQNLIRGCTLGVISQCLGITAVFFYSTKIFNNITNNNQTLSGQLNLIIPIIGIVCNLTMALLINLFTRKVFFCLGIFACVINLALLGMATSATEQSPVMVVLLIFTFLIFFQLSIGPGFWVVIPEILTPKGVCVATSVLWFATAAVGQIFPILLSATSISTCFYIFSFLGMLGIVYLHLHFNIEVQDEKMKDICQSLTEMSTLPSSSKPPSPSTSV